MNDYFIDLYGEELEPYSYDSFVEIWVPYADFYRDREAYFGWAISLYEPGEAESSLFSFKETLNKQ